MIDKRKNVCYVIEMYYIRAEKECSRKFLSQHQMDSRRFKTFAEDYFKNVFPVSKKKMGDFDGYVGSQWTVSREVWPSVKDEVLEGITEKEKCY